MIIVYSKNNCPACETLKATLTSRGIEFNVVNLDENEAAKSFLLSSGYRSVPQMFLDGRNISLADL